MTSTRQSGRSPMSIVSFLSSGCSDQADSGMRPLELFLYRRRPWGRKQHPSCPALCRLSTSFFKGRSGEPGMPEQIRRAACFLPLLAPNRGREIGGGRATRQPGQVRKEAALTRSGSGRSSVSYLFFERIAQKGERTSAPARALL